MIYHRDDQVLSAILSLMNIEISPEIIATWSDDDCQQAEDWASSDFNDDIVFAEPEFLQQYKH